MNIKCKQCGELYDLKESNCPKCGAANFYKKVNSSDTTDTISDINSVSNNVISHPTTIEELKKWYIQKNLPDENRTRFFIGKNLKEARVFGIYKDELTGNFVVYKNKSDGTRAVRYNGKDESYAVYEFWLRLDEEISKQKKANQQIEREYYANKGRNYDKGSETYNFAGKTITIQRPLVKLITFFVVVLCCFGFFKSNTGYYYYNGSYYYNQRGSWYRKDLLGWSSVYPSSELTNNMSKYSRSYPYSTSRFEDTEYYSGIGDFLSTFSSSDYSGSSSSSFWDSDSWSSDDSWDSSSTDWDSDW